MSTDLFALLGDIAVQLKRIADALDIQVAPQREKLEAERAEKEEGERLVALRREESLDWDRFLKSLKAWLPKARVKVILEAFEDCEVCDEKLLYDSYEYMREAVYRLAPGSLKGKASVVLTDLRRAAKNFFDKTLK